MTTPSLAHIAERRSDLRMVRCYVVVAEELSVSRAAERLAMDASVVSRRLRRFEDELGVQLLVRWPGRSLELTKAGMIVLEHGKDVLDCYDALVAAAHQPASGGSAQDAGTHHRVPPRTIA